MGFLALRSKKYGFGFVAPEVPDTDFAHEISKRTGFFNQIKLNPPKETHSLEMVTFTMNPICLDLKGLL